MKFINAIKPTSIKVVVGVHVGTFNFSKARFCYADEENTEKEEYMFEPKCQEDVYFLKEIKLLVYLFVAMSNANQKAKTVYLQIDCFGYLI